MAEYIEREALKKELQKKIELSRKARYALIEEDFVDIINDMPAADVAEVVRCKDCKNIGKFGHNFVCCEIGDVVEETFFCSRGKRMDGEGE